MTKKSVVAVIQCNGNTHGDQIVLVSRKGNYEDLGLPGGKVEHGETSLEAIAREVWEETGLSIPEKGFQLVIEDKPCGEYLVDVYCLDYFYRDTYSLQAFVNSEDSFVTVDHIKESTKDGCSFKDFNVEVWDTMCKKSILPWRTAEDVDVQVIINNLMGSCVNDIDSEIDTHSNGNLEMCDLTNSQLDEIDNSVMCCPVCNWHVDADEIDWSDYHGENVCCDCREYED